MRTKPKPGNKYGARKTTFGGYKYDSAFEASCAYQLDILLRSGEIAGVEKQFRADMEAYTADGQHALTLSHKIDFRILHLDGSYTLLEAKGAMTTDYRNRARWLKKLWLPVHIDHEYCVWHYGKPMPDIHKHKGKPLND